MKSNQTYRFNFPILRWLLVLFLATGISDFGQIPQQIYKVETVDVFPTKSRRKTRIAKYSAVPKTFLSSKRESNFPQTIKLLSFNLSKSIEVTLKRQTLAVHSFPQNTIRRFLIPNRIFPFSEEFSDFIS